MERGQAAQGKVGTPLQRLGLERPVLKLQQFLKGDLSLDAGQWRAKTEVPAPSERQVLVVRSRKVELIRVGEAIRVAICRAKYGKYGLMFSNAPAAEFGVVGSQTRCVLG